MRHRTASNPGNLASLRRAPQTERPIPGRAAAALDPDLHAVLRMLRRGSWFGRLPDDLQVRIVTRSRELRYRKSQLIQSQGTPGSGLAVVLEGQVATLRWVDDSQPVLLQIGGPGYWFGEIATLSHLPTMVTVEAHSDARILLLPAYEVEQMLAVDPSLYRLFAGIAFERYARSIRWVSEAKGLDPEGALRRRLADLIDQRREADHTAEPAVALSQGELAALVGLSRQTTNQLLQRFQERGWIEVSFRSIRVLDPMALRGTTGVTARAG